MTRTPDFDELVGLDIEHTERERLQRVHALLLEAGAPAELPPELEAGPTLALTLSRKRSRRPASRRPMLIAAAICLLALAFVGGYVAGNGGSSAASWKTLSLTGTPMAPAALASLKIEPVDSAGNWPMQLSVTGLPKLAAHAYYAVYLVRNGKPWAPCGTFVVDGAKRATSVTLNAPYRLQGGDTWIVTKQSPGQRGAGEVMLSPTT